MKPNIPLWTYLTYYRKNRRAILSVVDKVFRSGTLILGTEVVHFEKEFATFIGVRFGIGVGNGTDALFLALKALGVGHGDEVITVPNTAIPTVSAIVAAGATPVFVDIQNDTYLMDTNKLEPLITKRTKVLLPVHLYGQCVDMDAVRRIARKHHLSVLEDCAQATGAKWRGQKAGSFGDMATFSFYPTKTLGAFGDGGMVTTNSVRLAKIVRMLRMYGTKGSYYSHMQGYNSRLDEVQAAILRYQLRHIHTQLAKRRRLASAYDKYLTRSKVLALPVVHPQATHAWYLYVVRHPKRDAIIRHLARHGIIANVSYPHPVHLMSGYRFLGYKTGTLPIAEQAAKEIFSLPFYPDMSKKHQRTVVAILETYFHAHPHR